MSANAPLSSLRRVLDEPLARLLDEFEPRVAVLVRTEMGDALNQAVRRMRQCEDAAEVLATLLDAAGPFCAGAALLEIKGDRIAALRIRGVDEAAAEKFASIDVPLSSAAAIAGVVESRDPVTAARTATELSDALCGILPPADAARVSVFPVVSGAPVRAVLACWGAPQGGALELLAQTAGLALPAEAPAPVQPPPELVSIAPAPPDGGVPEKKAHPAWEDLPAEQQKTHLRAQRFARVQVSEMRLHHGDAVQAGRIHRDIYGALRDEIDLARDRFRISFVANCPSMVDYLYLELIRTLANDQIAFMGPDFPAPLV